MATNQASLFDVDEEDCITIELNPSSNSFSQSIGSPSPPQSKEFELQKEKKSKTFQADELFNKGKLSPIQESPRLQMVQKHLDNTNTTFNRVRSLSRLEQSSISTNAINPSGSRRFSSYEANQSEYLFEWFSGRHGFVVDAPKKTWSQKLKETKQFWLSQRLKASRDYLKSLFSKSRCSDANQVGAVIKSTCKDSQINNVNNAWNKKNPFEISYDNSMQKEYSCSVMHNISRNMHEDGYKNKSTSSFSGLFQRRCSSNASSLSAPSSGFSSKSSSGKFHDKHLTKRSSSENAEMERSIEAAIAYCKQSLKKCSSDKASGDDKISSELASETTVGGNQEKAALGIAEAKGE